MLDKTVSRNTNSRKPYPNGSFMLLTTRLLLSDRIVVKLMIQPDNMAFYFDFPCIKQTKTDDKRQTGQNLSLIHVIIYGKAETIIADILSITWEVGEANSTMCVWILEYSAAADVKKVLNMGLFWFTCHFDFLANFM